MWSSRAAWFGRLGNVCNWKYLWKLWINVSHDSHRCNWSCSRGRERNGLGDLRSLSTPLFIIMWCISVLQDNLNTPVAPTHREVLEGIMESRVKRKLSEREIPTSIRASVFKMSDLIAPFSVNISPFTFHSRSPFFTFSILVL